MMELLSRIRALLRRTEPEADIYRCGCLTVDPGRHIVTVNGREVALTQKEFEVLCLLLKNRGQVLSRERLIEEGVPDHAGVVAVGGAVEGGLGAAEGGEEQGAVAEALGRGELDLGPQTRGEVWRVGQGCMFILLSNPSGSFDNNIR